jgi:GTP-binding protein
MVAADSADIKAEYEVLLNELRKYSPELLHKERILAISKSDLLDDELTKAIRKELPKDLPHIFISSVAQTGLDKLKDMIWAKLQEPAATSAKGV